MDNKKKENGSLPESVPYIVYEGELARQERNFVRIFILCIVLFIALIATNFGWVLYESQFKEEVITSTQTITQDTGSEGGTNSFSGDFYGGDYNVKTDSEKDHGGEEADP